jgi:putative intracellular protease/amidase
LDRSLNHFVQHILRFHKLFLIRKIDCQFRTSIEGVWIIEAEHARLEADNWSDPRDVLVRVYASRLQELAASSFRAGKITAVLCHATCLLLKTKLNGKLLVDGKTWTGFANSEEEYADAFVGKRIQPFWIQEEARKVSGTNFIVSGRFKEHAVRDGNLITGQQQYSGTAVARLVIESFGV